MKIFVLIMILFAGLHGYAQSTNQQYLGTTKNKVITRNVHQIDSAFNFPKDTIKGLPADTLRRTIPLNGIWYTYKRVNGVYKWVADSTDFPVDTTIFKVVNGVLTANTGGDNLQVVSDANYTVPAGVGTVAYSVLTAHRVLTLPNAPLYPKRQIHIINNTGGAFNIQTNLNLRFTPVLTTSTVIPNRWLTIQSDGTDWWIIAHNNP